MLLIDLIYNLSVLVALSALSGFINTRYDRSSTLGKLLQGLLFGLVAIIGMLYPFELVEGVIFDGRSIVISLCALFFGPLAGIISSIMAIAFRNYLGGGGALTGTLVITASFIIGFYFYYRRTKNKFNLSKINLYLFGVLTSAAMMALMLSLPSASILSAYKTITFTVMISYPIISLVIGKILLDQEENKNSIEKIKQEESLFRTTLYSIGDAVITTDKKGKVQYMNPIAEKLTGWGEDDAKGKILTEVFKIINEETRLDVENPVVRVLKEKTIVGLANHTLLISKNGNEIPIADSGAPIINENDEIIGVVLVFRDQTEDYANQKRLIENEIRFRSIVEGAPDAIFVQTDHNFTYLNSKACNIFGCKSRDELIGKKVIERFHPADREKVAERIHQLNDNKHEVPVREETIIRMDGTLVTAEFSAMPITYEGKYGALVFFRDVTERKKTEKIIEESERKYRYLFEKNPHPMLIYEIESLKIIDVNNTAVMKYGYSREEFLKMTVVDLRPNEEKEKFLHITQSNRPDLHTTGPWKHVLKNGTEIIVEVSSHVIEYQKKRARIIVVHDITEKVKAEIALRQSEERWQFALEGPGDGVWDWNVKTNEVIFSHQWKVMLGYEDNEITDSLDEWKRLVHPDDLDSAIEDLQKHFKGETPFYQNEQRLLCKDGSYRWILDRGKVMSWCEDGSPLRMIGTHSDISLQKKAEDALRQSEEKMRLIIEGSSFFFFYTQNTKADITYISPTVEKITGHKAEDWINQRHWFATDNPINDEARKRTHMHLNGEMIFEPLNLEVRHKNGSFILLEIFETPILKEGKVIGLQGIARDITADKKAEESLRLSEEKFRFLFENHSAVKLIICADTGDIYDANFAAANYYGWSRNELMQMNINQINILSRTEIEKEMERARNQKRIRFEFKHKLADGSVRDVEVFSSKILIEGKDYLHSIIQDITEKKKAEEQLKQHRDHLEELVKIRTRELDEANKKLQLEIEKEREVEKKLQLALEKEKELSELKSRFISTTSHEFRTPLTSVLSSAELIQRYGRKWPDEKLDYHTDKIKNSIEYLTNLLDDVLTISRSDSGKIVFDPVIVNLENIMIELIDEARHNAKEMHKINYDLKLSQKEFILDPKLIRFIITNLLSNAIKYSPKGGNIDVNVKNAERTIEIKIKDEGIGIPESEIPFLFEPFHRANNTIEIPGTGLGLSIVKRSVDLHGGQIKIESEINKGTAFLIYLPIN